MFEEYLTITELAERLKNERRSATKSVKMGLLRKLPQG